MNKFTIGLLTGGVVGAIGITYAVSDARLRKKIIQDGRHIMHKAGDALNDV